jgi:mono/diheme cytochrome c family protein
MKKPWIPVAISLICASPAYASTPQAFLAQFNSEAQKTSSSFQGFDARRGQQWFTEPHGGEWSCSSCHTSNPAAMGKHRVTGKPIDPLAPVANPERFTNPAKVEKWFKRNCKDVLKRECTPQEKGDVLTYLLSIAR